MAIVWAAHPWRPKGWGQGGSGSLEEEMEQCLLNTGSDLVLHSVMGRGRKRKGRFRRRTTLKEGATATAHFANSLQPPLPSQWYTYSTSPPALNSLLSLNRTSTEKTNILRNAVRLWLNIDHPCYKNMKSRLWTTNLSKPFPRCFWTQLTTETFGWVLVNEIQLAWRNVFHVNSRAASVFFYFSHRVELNHTCWAIYVEVVGHKLQTTTKDVKWNTFFFTYFISYLQYKYCNWMVSSYHRIIS